MQNSSGVGEVLQSRFRFILLIVVFIPVSIFAFVAILIEEVVAGFRKSKLFSKFLWFCADYFKRI